MMAVRFALIAEGRTEEALLGHLRELCLRGGVGDVEDVWADDLLNVFDDVGKDIASRVRAILRADPAINLLFIHRDADARSDQVRRAEIERGVASSDCMMAYVPIIPIQEIEAWLLVDPDAIRRVVANPGGKDDLGLPKLGQIEQRASPKEILRDALRQASKPGRGRGIDTRTFGILRRRLLEDLDVDGPVTQLTAWQSLLRDLNAALAELRSP